MQVKFIPELYFASKQMCVQCRQLNQPVSWHKLESAKIALTGAHPISKYNKVALNLTTSESDAGISNTGYWGVPLNGGWIYRFSVYLKGSDDAKVFLSQPDCHLEFPLRNATLLQSLQQYLLRSHKHWGGMNSFHKPV